MSTRFLSLPPAAAVLLLLLCFFTPARGQDAAGPVVGPPAPEWMRFEHIVDLPDTPAAAQARWLIGVLRGDDPEPINFRMSEELKAKVSPEGFRDFVAQARAALGWSFPTHIIRSEDHALTLYLQTATDETRWVLQTTVTEEHPDLLGGVILQPAPIANFPRVGSWDDLSAAIDGAGYDASFMVLEIDEGGGVRTAYSRNSDRSLNISGASSVFVLGATAQKIAKELEATPAPETNPWESLIAYDPALRGVPDSPMTQVAPGTEMPVATYAGQMLQGDDAATEHLIKWTSPEVIESFIEKIRADSPPNKPFLTTRQAIALKLSFDDELREKFAQADEATRRRIAGSLEVPGAEQMKLWIKPQGIGKVGHFASARELVSVLSYLRDASAFEGMEPLREILGANQQLRLDSGYWRSVAFTAGAEAGVLATCLILERNDGKWFIAATIFNDADEPLSGQVTSPIMMGMFDLMQREE